MKADEIKRIAVVGSGLMGYQIGMEFALAGYEVYLNDVTEEKLSQAVKNIQADIQTFIELGLLSHDQVEPALSRIHTSLALKDAVEDVDVVIESVFEDLVVKQRVFKELDRLCPERTILVSNSSGLPPSDLASATRRPDRVLVANHNNPTYLMPLVDVVRGEDTSDETVETIFDLLTKVGKKPVLEKEPGYVFNHLQRVLLREALSIVSKGIATPQEVDTVLKSGVGRRYSLVGILEYYDSFGPWERLYNNWSDWVSLIESSTEIPEVLKDKVEKGELATKTAMRFYEWPPNSVEAYKKRLVKALAEFCKFYQKIQE